MKSILRAVQAVLVVLLVTLLASCGIGGSGPDAGSDSKSAGSKASSGSGGGVPGLADTSSTSRDKATAPTAKQAASPLSRAVISTGQISLHPRSIGQARADLLRLVTSWNGTVADEQTNSDDHGRTVDSTLTLRVPTGTFSQAMDQLARLGKVEQQSRKSEDVTTKVIDNSARVRAAERSIRQIELLLGRAEALRDIIAIESDLARRQADLDSLKSQQAWLEDQTALSTITVFLTRPDTISPPTDEARGFLAGLRNGWDALTGTTVVLLTVLGAALPFAVLLCLVGVPLWLVVRRRLGTRLNGGSAPARSA